MCQYLFGEFDEGQSHADSALIEGIKRYFQAEQVVPDGNRCIILVPDDQLPLVRQHLEHRFPQGLRRVILPALAPGARSETFCRAGVFCTNQDVDLDFERSVKPVVMRRLAHAGR